jgi:hypothetical protein
MSECPHADARRAKRVIDGVVHVLCDECFANWDPVVSPQVHAAPDAPLDERRLAGDLYELWQLAEVFDATRVAHEAAAKEFRAQLWVVKHRYTTARRDRSLSWKAIADALGTGRQRLQLFASYNQNPKTRGEPQYVFRPLQRQQYIAAAERRARVEERHRAALRALGIARAHVRNEPYDISEYAERGSDPEQGEQP